MMENIKRFLSNLENVKIRRIARYGTIFSILLLLIFTFVTDVNVRDNREYSDWDHVALYIIEFNDLPENYVPKSQGVSSDEYDVTVFAVYDNTRVPVKLPVGYTYTEAYINATKNDIGRERFVFSDEQLFYTDDHYDSFEEVNRFDVLGTHYITVTLFWVVILGTSTLAIVSIKWNVLTFQIIKDDFKGDWIITNNFIKEKFNLLRERIEK